MDDNTKFVAFDKYCEKCKYEKRSATNDPCNTCLETGARDGTEVPTEYKEKEDKA